MAMNLDLIARTMNRIEADPSQWNQMAWDRCFAGTALKEAGYAVEDPFYLNPDAPRAERVSLRTAAQQVLELSDWNAITLFAGSNTLDDLRRITTDLIGHAVADEITEALSESDLVDA